MTAYPIYTAEEGRARETFLALMWTFSYPGRARTLPVAPADIYAAIAGALIDLETSYYTPDPTLAADLARTGGRALPPDQAEYHFYPTLTDLAQADGIAAIRQASIGTLLYPDQAATLFVGCTLGQGETFTLTGPGIPSDRPVALTVGGLPSDLWTIRAAARYPRGWDLYLIDGDQVVGLPRTTQIEKA